MDIVGCGISGFENWEGLLDYSSSGLFTDLPTEKIFKSTLGLELNCKPLDGEKCPVNLLEQYSVSGDLASHEEIFPRTSKIGQLIRGQLDYAHAEQITHDITCNKRLILHVKGSNASSANGKKRKKVVHNRSLLAESEKDQRNKYKGEGSDGKQIPEESSSTKNNLKQDHVQAKTKCIQLTKAERIRREKISERMEVLQDIVPGCSKIIGKAAMLDEIINYVLSLQQQIEFLSRKVAIVSPDLDLDNQLIPSRDANSNMIHHLQDYSTSSTIQAEFSHGTLLDTRNLNHLKVLLPQASMWNNGNLSSSKTATQYSWFNC